MALSYRQLPNSAQENPAATRRGAGPPYGLVPLVAARRVFDAANGILNFALGLIGSTRRLELGIASDFSGRLFDNALGLVGRPFDPIFVHSVILS